MKLFLGFLVAAVFAAEISATSLGNITDTDGWFVPTVDGEFFWMTREHFENEYIQTMERNTFALEYFLYTRENPEAPEQLYMDDIGSVASSHFNKDKPTRFIVHGWENDPKHNYILYQAFIKVGNYNVICVDWTSASDTSNYTRTVSVIPKVGKVLALFIDFLNENTGMSFEDLTLIGLSLGAHVCGYAGKNVKRGRVGAITGLDPAYPLYDYSNCDTRLCSTDAMFVDSIQTNGKLLGFLEPIEKVAYYPNGGKFQPACVFDLTVMCSHIMANVYYVEALLKNNFIAIKCRDYKAAVAKDCEESFSDTNMGSLRGHLNDGCYYVPVNMKSPFGTG